MFSQFQGFLHPEIASLSGDMIHMFVLSRCDLRDSIFCSTTKRLQLISLRNLQRVPVLPGGSIWF